VRLDSEGPASANAIDSTDCAIRRPSLGAIAFIGVFLIELIVINR
jgi:hypothetical protein